MLNHPVFITIVGILAVLLIGFLGYLAYRKSGTDYTWLQFGFWCVAKFFTKFMWRTKYINEMPDWVHDGCIFVCNHHSGVDPFFIQVQVRRPIRWMVAKEYCQHKLFGWFLHHCHVIPVNRGGIDTSSTKAAIRCAEEGGMLGMFPEGRLNMTEDFMLPVRPGAVLVALRTGTPLLPCFIKGSPTKGTAISSFTMRANVEVTFGEPIDVSEFKNEEQDDKQVVEIMTRVVKEIARIAGEEDFEPKFAGRKWRPSDEEVQAHRMEKLRREST